MKFSVVIPLFNKAPFVRDAVLSAVDQSHPPAEIIVVDDGSTDGGLERISDLPVRIISQRNQGPGIARNAGIAAAEGEWVALLDGDDLWLTDHLETLAEIISTTNAPVVGASFSRSVEPEDQGPANAYVPHYFREAVERGVLWTSSVAIRADVARENPFIAEYPGEDYELWTRLALKYPVGCSRKVTTFYRQHTGGLIDQMRLMPFPPGKEPEMLILDAALEDPKYAELHHDLRAYKAHLLDMRVRQAIYAADGEAARVYRALGGRSSVGKLAALPDSILRIGMMGWKLAKKVRRRK